MFIYTGVINLYRHELYRDLQRSLREDNEEARFSDIHTHFSYILEKKLTQTGIGEIFELINFGITLILIFFYIFSTYTYPETTTFKEDTNHYVNLIEIYLCVYLIVHFVLKFYTSQSRLYFLFDFISLIDYASIICILVAQQSFVSKNLKYFLRLFRIVRVFYLFKLEYILQKRYNETVRYSYKLLINFISILFLSAGLLLEIENLSYRNKYGEDSSAKSKIELSNKGKQQLLQFHDMVYFEIITITTMGFGDISLKVWISRFIVIATIISILVLVLLIYSKLKIIFALTSKYSRIEYQKKSKKTQHLIVLGECGVESFKAFLEELYNEDHGRINYETVIMQSMQNVDIMKEAKKIVSQNKICYLVGNSLKHADFMRCKADQAICAVVLANKLAKDPVREDFENIIKAFAYRNHCHIFCKGANPRVCIQLLRPETKNMYFSSLIKPDEMNKQDQVICVEEIKLQLLGKSCLCPGITTIISSLITSKKPTIEEVGKIPREMKWLQEYIEGIQLEIYVITLRAELVHNMKFIDVVKLIYEIANLVVIGIDVIVDDMKPFVCLNPSSYVLSPFDHLVYILADKQPDEYEINKKIKENLERKKKGIVENNQEMVKILRMKNPYWNKLSSNTKTKANTSFSSDKSSSLDVSSNAGKYLQNMKDQKKDETYAEFKRDYTLFQQKLDLFSRSKQNFLYTTTPRTQHEAEFFSPDILEHHIIVCGITINLKNLLMPLRAASMKNQQYPIVILDKGEHVPSGIWKEIQYYPDIYYIQGNPIKSKDLQKAGIKKAKAVIILSKSTANETQADIIDADTIFIYGAIKNETKTALIIADLTSAASIQFMNSPSSKDDKFNNKQGYWLSGPFAEGELYISSMLDTLICQSFYNPYITDILQQLIMGSAGTTFSSRMIKKLTAKKISQSTLYLLNINEEVIRFGRKTFPKKVKYKEIFQFFVKNNMVPIGINRNSSKLSNRNKNDKRYVFMCPQNNTEIDIDHDKIYVLAGEEYIKKEKTADSSKAKTLNYYQNSRASKLIDKLNEQALEIVQNMKKINESNAVAFQRAFSSKRVVNSVRSSIRSELAKMHDRIAEEQSNPEDNEDDKEKENEEEEDSKESSKSSNNDSV